MRTLLSTCFALSCASAAAAGCPPADPFAALSAINTSPTPYSVWYGATTITGPADASGRIPMAITGEDVVHGVPVQAAFVCKGAGCAAAKASDKALVFVEITGSNPVIPVLAIDACPTFYVADIDAGLLGEVRSEIRGIMGQDE